MPRGSSLHFWNFVLGVLVLVEIATGISMAYFGIPAYLQPIHLLVGSIILGIQFFLIVRIKEQTEQKEIITHS
jgi:cytochrome c oxidase assembly protein subunit 15